MIRDITIQNFKSVSDVKLSLGRINVLIGENGCGKSNILEGIALASASLSGKLENEFLASRGVRTAETSRMLSAFAEIDAVRPFDKEQVVVGAGDVTITLVPQPESWASAARNPDGSLQPAIVGSAFFERIIREAVSETLAQTGHLNEAGLDEEARRRLEAKLPRATQTHPLFRFLIYSPENTALRNFYREGQILPLGIKGEGLFAHLRKLDPDLVVEIGEHLKLIDWFDGFDIPTDLGPGERRLNIRDRYLSEDGILDQRSANEGFLFLLFYFTLFVSPKTPEFFAVDNIDASLNPKLCRRLMQDLVSLAEKHDKQAIFTTHNPAILDGLDLNDDEQRLFVVSRSPDGPTRIRRVKAPQPVGDDAPVTLSEAFMRGYLGGLPKSF